MSRIHFLKVKHGDAFVIECNIGDNRGVIVVDGGPTGCGYVLQNELRPLGTPDLLVLTHYDDDHIGGILQLINTCRDDGVVPAKEVWANCAGYAVMDGSKTTSPKQGVLLSTVLEEFAEKSSIVWRNDISEGFTKEFPFAAIEVLAPTSIVLGKAIKKQEDEGRQQLKATQKQNEELSVSLEDLSKHIPESPNIEKDNELANASSIAFVLRCDDLSILMLGDCYPQDVERYLREVKGYSEDNPLEVDYVKISHHGSRNNTSNGLLDIIKCYKYLISTNGGKYNSNHPDRTAIAHILCHPERNVEEKVHLFFNYGIDLIERVGTRFLNEGESIIWNFEIHENVSEL